MLTEEIKAKWIEALESGKYKQGRGGLKQIGHIGIVHCCLGVLGEVLQLPFEKRDALHYRIYRDTCCLPFDILSFEIQGKFMRMNDGERMTFTEIAAEIRKMEGI